jgi:hypothetical protein
VSETRYHEGPGSWARLQADDQMQVQVFEYAVLQTLLTPHSEQHAQSLTRRLHWCWVLAIPLTLLWLVWLLGKVHNSWGGTCALLLLLLPLQSTQEDRCNWRCRLCILGCS